MITIQKITDPHCEAVGVLSRLAEQIWHQHFVTIISRQQIEYMLDKYQSRSAVSHQLAKEGYIYYLAYEGQEPVGYAGIVAKPEEKAIFLSKLYVKKEHRGKGIARELFRNFLKDQAGSEYTKVYLTCNKKNEDSIKVYLHMGFTITDDVVSPIGNGMVMDDYIMTMPLKNDPDSGVS